MNKRRRFAFEIAAAIALTALLILTSGSALAEEDLPDFGDLGDVLPPPAMATATPTPEATTVPTTTPEPAATPSSTETPTPVASPTTGEREPEEARPRTPVATQPPSRNLRGPCTLWTTSGSNAQGFPFLGTPRGTVHSSSVAYLLGSTFTVNYGSGPYVISARLNCTSVTEKYLSGATACPSDGYGPWQSSGGVYCVRTISPGFWRGS